MAPSASPDYVEVERPTLRDFLAVLRRRRTMLVVVAAIVPAVALAHDLRAEKQYTATAELLFRDPGFDQKLFGSSILTPSPDPVREAATNAELVSLYAVAQRTATALGISHLTPQDVRNKVKVRPQGQADIVSVTATDRSPSFAALLANTLAQQFILFRRDADRAKLTQAATSERQQLSQVPSGSPSSVRQSVAARVEQLQFLAALQTGNAELVQQATAPPAPSSPRPLRDFILGLVAGLALGVAMAVVADRLDRRLRAGADAEGIFARPVLGTIYESTALRLGGEVIHLSGRESDAFRALRTNLRYFAIDQEVTSLLLTSPAPGDGKSTVARYLAATAARGGVSVILIEADLRRPVLQRTYGHLRPRGLTDVLTGQLQLLDVIQQLPVFTVPTSPDDSPILDVIAAGPIPPNPADLLESERMREVLRELEGRYDLVIIDTSPVSVVPDAIPLLSAVSGVAVVVRLGSTSKTGLRKLKTQLDNLNISLMGVILNGVKFDSEGTDYAYYGYPAYSQAETASGAGNGSRRLLRSGRR